jgi:uncharacterized protein YcgI (DUF1989 family)
MPDPSDGVIPARRGVAVPVDAGRRIKVVNTHGSQVLDTWAFNAADVSEYMSMDHTRSVNSRWAVAVGIVFVSTRRRPMLTLVEDSTPGAHDTLLCACNAEIYQELGVEGHHDNCEENLYAALAALGLKPPCSPAPLNLFMNVPINLDGTVTRLPPSSRPADHLTFRAEMDQIVVFSACPQDITPINGLMRKPTDAHYAVF